MTDEMGKAGTGGLDLIVHRLASLEESRNDLNRFAMLAEARLQTLEKAAPDEPEAAAPCPWCGAFAEVVQRVAPQDHSVFCKAEDCRATGPYCDTSREAVEAWNRVAAK
jgi:hypothetical protein